MGLLGLGKGIVKVIEGVVTGDSEALIKGVKKTAINAVTTTVSAFSGRIGETAGEDDDPDD